MSDVLSLLVSMRDGVNMSSKTLEGDSGTATVGPTDDVKSLMETELSMDDYCGGDEAAEVPC